MKTRDLAPVHLSKRHESYLKHWRIARRGIFLPPNEGERGIYVWSGRFVCGETVTITADELTKPDDTKSNLFVGVVKEEACLAGDLLEACADAATHQAPGIKGAIFVLNLIKGLPNGDKMVFETPASLE